jgi:hypothetical protein
MPESGRTASLSDIATKALKSERGRDDDDRTCRSPVVDDEGLYPNIIHLHLSFVDNSRSRRVSIFLLFTSQRNKQTSLFLLAKSRQKEKLKFNNLKKFN